MKALVLITVMILTASCATLFGDSNDSITITSEPSGATVYLNAKKMGVTPVTFVMDRSVFDKHYIQLKKKGYKTNKFLVKKTIATAAVFNLSSLSSWATDVTTGNMMKYSPTDYLIELEKKNGKSTSSIYDEKDLKYMLVNNKLILKDIAQGGGEYISSALKSFEISSQNQPKAIEKLRKKLPFLISQPTAYEVYKEMKKILEV